MVAGREPGDRQLTKLSPGATVLTIEMFCRRLRRLIFFNGEFHGLTPVAIHFRSFGAR